LGYKKSQEKQKKYGKKPKTMQGQANPELR